MWANADEFIGESLLLIARQQPLSNGGRPDIIGLASDARVVVIEIKRDVDRSQLAHCLEYARWVRTTSLDELAGMYHGGAEAFFRDWQELDAGRLDLTVETLVADDSEPYHDLFSENTVTASQARLEEASGLGQLHLRVKSLRKERDRLDDEIRDAEALLAFADEQGFSSLAEARAAFGERR